MSHLVMASLRGFPRAGAILNPSEVSDEGEVQIS